MESEYEDVRVPQRGEELRLYMKAPQALTVMLFCHSATLAGQAPGWSARLP